MLHTSVRYVRIYLISCIAATLENAKYLSVTLFNCHVVNLDNINNGCFLQAGGIDCLCDILCDGGRSAEDTALSSERVKCEAAGVLAQITSPQFAQSSHATEVLYSSFIDNMADLVNSLTGYFP